MTDRYYVTTPIYYVNDRPHIGHVYTTTVADVLARYHRLCGHDVFFLTGTDEHAAKVVDAAADHDMTPQEWADHNAAQFQETFARLGITNDDFIRTTQDRHKKKVIEYIRALIASGDVYVGDYEGWYDAGQEEYVPENKAKESDYKSPVNGKPLVRKKERNDFFALKKYESRLRELVESGDFVMPEARRNEVLGRIREGLNDVPVSRSGVRGWGIEVPDSPDQTIYVWIDALFNYLSTIDTDERRHYWPANVHMIGKDILWFHAVIWPAMLMALSAQPGMEWLARPHKVYAHSYWIHEGQKMSKSLGNFIDLETIDRYVDQFGLDAFRYFLATNGPMGATDSDFAESRFIDVYNADLANTFGNCASRVTKMIGRYFDGKLPAPTSDSSKVFQEIAGSQPGAWFSGPYKDAADDVDPARMAGLALDLVRGVDGYIEKTQPFKLAKDPDKKGEVADILYNSAESLRLAALALWPIIPGKVEEFWQRLGCTAYAPALADRGRGDLNSWTGWGQLQPDVPIEQGDPLFPRFQPTAR